MKTLSGVVGEVVAVPGTCSRAVVGILLMVNWGGIRIEGSAVAGALSQASGSTEQQ